MLSIFCDKYYSYSYFILEYWGMVMVFFQQPTFDIGLKIELWNRQIFLFTEDIPREIKENIWANILDIERNFDFGLA